MSVRCEVSEVLTISPLQATEEFSDLPPVTPVGPLLFVSGWNKRRLILERRIKYEYSPFAAVSCPRDVSLGNICIAVWEEAGPTRHTTFPKHMNHLKEKAALTMTILSLYSEHQLRGMTLRRPLNRHIKDCDIKRNWP
ncbi:unnamed protein product [Pleuronectes platessa]|uniref:Uncharacterized protein n=1 Tax=Pleuronectes platessa TaxID=8262 RepID=A0A9N7UHH4_PLEPL|nr:unnamed protein product [Pleuronectes platessa]